MVARPPIGVRHEPSSAASIARSAATQAALAASFSGPSSRCNAASPARHSTASAPWPTAGSISSVDRISLATSALPSRSSPHNASTSASTSPAASLSSRVPTLPRIGAIARSGRARSNCAVRRNDAVPTRASLGNCASGMPPRDTSTSRGLSRGRIQPISSPAGRRVSMSFRECTARSMRRSRSASSISFVKRPLPPISASSRVWTRSPVVRIGAISIPCSAASSGCASRSRSRTSPAWKSAIALPRVPMRMGRAATAAPVKACRVLAAPTAPAQSRRPQTGSGQLS